MEIVPLGKLASDDAERDAFHVAILPVVAAVDVHPGQSVGINANGDGDPQSDHIGIVDPFLSHRVAKGDRFYLCLTPNSVTGMRHHWTHPVVDVPRDKDASRKWMEEFASQHYSSDNEYYRGLGRSYTADEVMEFATDFLETGDRHVQQGSESLRDYEFPREFWLHYEVITGTSVSDATKEHMPFCCTC